MSFRGDFWVSQTNHFSGKSWQPRIIWLTLFMRNSCFHFENLVLFKRDRRGIVLMWNMKNNFNASLLDQYKSDYDIQYWQNKPHICSTLQLLKAYQTTWTQSSLTFLPFTKIKTYLHPLTPLLVFSFGIVVAHFCNPLTRTKYDTF